MPVATRRVLHLALAAVVVVVAIGAVVLLVGRSRLEDADATIDRRWLPLRSALATRYEKLTRLDATFESADVGRREVRREQQRLLRRWGRLRHAPEVDAEAEAATADALEKTAGRLIRLAYQPDELRDTPGLGVMITAFMRSEVPLPALTAYNEAVVAYEDTRDSFLWAPAAHLLRYDGRSGLGLFV